ncbi:MAG: L-fucose:H+ symporter permease [Bacteroidales bacterium]|nr:L-fucose:H+ symporter permease [Bacteroidales bacterium]
MTSVDDKNKNSTTAFVMLVILFFLWGVANNMTGTMLQDFSRIISMSAIQEDIINSAFYVAYFFASLPAVYYLYRRNSYKNCILSGLMLYAVGTMLFFPAASMESYMIYLLAIYVMAAGCTALETVANTYIIASAPTHDIGIRRLNLAQSFNPLGSMLGIVLCQWLVDSNLQYDNNGVFNHEIIREELDAVTVLYAGVGEVLFVVLLALIFINIRPIPHLMIGTRTKDFFMSIRRLFLLPSFRRGMLALLLYMCAQTGVWGYTVPAIGEQEGEYDATYLYKCSILAFAISRFLYTWLMTHYRYQKLILINTIGALVACIMVMFGSGIVVVVALIMLSCVMSLMFATIFGMALENTGRDMQTGGALLVMMIVGGALVMPVQGFVAAKVSAQMSYMVPSVCFLGVLMYVAFTMLLNEKK